MEINNFKRLFNNTIKLQILIDQRLSENVISIDDARLLRKHLNDLIEKLFSPDNNP